MNRNIYTISEFATLTGVTKRTLRYYDRKGLLKPSDHNSLGHRMYSDKDLMQLQRILTLKYLDYSLHDIGELLKKPEQNFRHSLGLQKHLLVKKQKELQQVLETLNKVEKLIGDSAEVDTELLIALIQTIQHEETHKQWLKQYLPQTFVDLLLMKDIPESEQLAFERQMTGLLIELNQMCRSGKSVHETEVQEKGQQLYSLVHQLLSPLSFEELETLDFPDSYLPYVPFLSEELDTYLNDLFSLIVIDGEELNNEK